MGVAALYRHNRPLTEAYSGTMTVAGLQKLTMHRNIVCVAIGALVVVAATHERLAAGVSSTRHRHTRPFVPNPFTLDCELLIACSMKTLTSVICEENV